MRLITVAIHTYDRAVAVSALLESEGIKVTLQNVNLENPEVSSGVRLRIAEQDLPLALRILENPDIFNGLSMGIPGSILPQSVVVPTDFSEYAFAAACVGIKIAAAHQTDVTLVHSYIDPRVTANVQLSSDLTYGVGANDVVEQLVSTANARMTKLCSRIKDEMKAGRLPMVRFNHVVVEGVPEDSIVEFCKTRPPYLVVMGTRSASAKEKDMIGSVTGEVLDECRFSVLTVPDRKADDIQTPPRNILFFSNLDQADILAMDTLYRYFSDSRARVTIVNLPQRHRFTDKTSGESALALSDYCSKKFSQYTFESIPMHPKTAVAELNALQAKRQFDLIVVPNRRRSKFTRMFNPGIAHSLLFHADIPMLVIPV